MDFPGPLGKNTPTLTEWVVKITLRA